MQRRTAMTWGGVGAGIAGLGLALVFCSSVSCSGSLTEYEPYPSYPARIDPIVTANPTSHPTAPAPAGKLDDWLKQRTELGGKVFEVQSLQATDRAAISEVLVQLFGTPSAPIVDSTDLAVSLLKLEPTELADGSKLFRRHCANCHGLMADGRGPAGLFVYPHPRDVRLGKMKFVSSLDGNATPTRSNLEQIIRAGVPGTSMPPFHLANDTMISKLTTATIHLSIRGEVETKLLISALMDEPPENWLVEGRRLLTQSLSRWANAETNTLKIPDETDRNDDSIRRGYALFISEKAGCLSCHEDFGRKDAYRYDAWGTAARVANLTEREFRGGKLANDLFCRIRLGIVTVGMPAQPNMTDAEVWDLVHFVSVLKTPVQLPSDVRAKIYP